MKNRVMFVDDEINLLNGLRRILRKKQNEWDILFAGSAREALEIFLRTPCDLIVTDYKMPEMDGLQLLEEVKRRYPGTARILLTGQSETEIFEKAKKLDHQYLAKPCKNDDLFIAVERGLQYRNIE